MYEHLLDYPEVDNLQPGPALMAGLALPEGDRFMSAYQQHRQRVYRRAEHMLQRGGYRHAEVEDAKTEAALVRTEAQISRARGEQLRWVKGLLLNNSPLSFGYRNAVDYVVSRADVRAPPPATWCISLSAWITGPWNGYATGRSPTGEYWRRPGSGKRAPPRM